MSATKASIRMVTRLALALGCALTIESVFAGASQDGHEPTNGWLAEITQHISDAEYAITWQSDLAIEGIDAAWQAPNRAQGFRTYFTPNGIRVVPRKETETSWDLALTLLGDGGPAALRVKENVIEYDRSGIAERYVNSHRGLEQRFTIASAPSTHGRQTGVVEIELALNGTLSPVISEDGQAIDFATASGVKVLHVAGLEARDARGRRLAARMDGFNHDGLRGIRIGFDDGDAVYPVTVDLLATSAAWTTESNQSGAELGVSVATAGDVNGDGYSDVIVGANLYDDGQDDEGRAFVYHGSAAGLQTAAAWTAEGDQALAEFGFSVATAGDVNGDGYSDVVVGAPTYSNGQSKEGRVFVFHGSAGGLQATPAWTAEGDQSNAEFGSSAGTAGDVNGDGYSDVIVGSHRFDNGITNVGRAFVYHGSSGGLQQFVAWIAESGQAGAELSISVATAGDVNGDGFSDVIVGAHLFDHGETDEGRAFVYHGSSAGLLSTPSWTGESNQDDAQFGNSVATAGDVNGDGYADVIVGSHQLSHGQAEEGRAYLFLGSATGVKTTPSWTAEGDQVSAGFGQSVAPAGDVNGDGYADVIVGAVAYDNGSLNEGRAFVYYGSAAGLRTSPAWTAESDQVDALFGSAVGTAGDVNGDGYADVIVGSVEYDRGETDEGAAFVYLGSPGGLQTAVGWTADGNQGSADFGISVATAGDVNGDGYSDVIVGADFYDNAFIDEGRAFLYLGSASGLSVSPAWTAEGKQEQAQFGVSVATAGDVNGDGYSDVIVGAARYDHGEIDEGRALVYHGSAEGLETAAAWAAEGDQSGAMFGSSAATAGDVNGDGYSDVVVGAWAYEDDQKNEGRAYVYLGSATGLQAGPSWTADGDQVGAFYGWAVGTAGDVNGDGYSDVIVGAVLYDNVERNEGRAFVYHGSSSGLEVREAWTAESNQEFVNFGFSVSTAGDVNGDGFSDVIVGAYLYDNGQVGQGRTFAYHGSPNGLNDIPAWTAEIGQANAWFGYSVASAGDVNGDGYSDVIVGAPSVDSGNVDEGRAFVYLGSIVGLQFANWTAESNQTGALFGSSVATAGDVNGDGYSDVVVGANRYDNGQTNEGQVFVHYGNGGLGVSLRPQQRRTSDISPIAPLGASDSLDSFRLAVVARSPFGRGRLKLEWEVKPFGVTLNGLGTQTAVESSDTDTTGTPLNELVSGLDPGTRYHWRVRTQCDPVTTPFMPRGRWLRAPFGGWEEAMLRTGAAPAGRVPDGTAGTPLTLAKASGGQITLSWGASCSSLDTDYEVYEGSLRNFTSHIPRQCSTGGMSATLAPIAEDSYYLVVPRNPAREGSYGTDGAGVERPIGQEACLPQQFAFCQ